MKLFLFAILFAAPVSAQSFDPTLYGQRYCLLRSFQVEEDAARKAAVAYSWRPERSVLNLTEDVRQAAKYVVRNCN
jgi:hypothetical protein